MYPQRKGFMNIEPGGMHKFPGFHEPPPGGSGNIPVPESPLLRGDTAASDAWNCSSTANSVPTLSSFSLACFASLSDASS